MHDLTVSTELSRSRKSLIQIPWTLKRRWQGRLRELVQAWAGVELEETDMYGMREYTEGARLLTHVDREATHAASLIVNIAQENVTSPWTVEVGLEMCYTCIRCYVLFGDLIFSLHYAAVIIRFMTMPIDCTKL